MQQMESDIMNVMANVLTELFFPVSRDNISRDSSLKCPNEARRESIISQFGRAVPFKAPEGEAATLHARVENLAVIRDALVRRFALQMHQFLVIYCANHVNQQFERSVFFDPTYRDYMLGRYKEILKSHEVGLIDICEPAFFQIFTLAHTHMLNDFSQDLAIKLQKLKCKTIHVKEMEARLGRIRNDLVAVGIVPRNSIMADLEHLVKIVSKNKTEQDWVLDQITNVFIDKAMAHCIRFFNEALELESDLTVQVTGWDKEEVFRQVNTLPGSFYEAADFIVDGIIKQVPSADDIRVNSLFDQPI